MLIQHNSLNIYPSYTFKLFPFIIVDNIIVKSEQIVSAERFPGVGELGYDSSVLLYK